MLLHGGEPLRPLDELAEEITTRAAQISADTCHWLGLVAEFDERRGWEEWACKSCAHWVAWRCSMEAVTAREHVRVARGLARLSQVREAFAAGELSYTKVRALTRLDNVEQETELLQLARTMTAEQLRRSVAAFRGVTAVEAGHERAVERRSVDFWEDDDGVGHLRCRFPAEELAIVRAAVEAARDALNQTAFVAAHAEAAEPDAAGATEKNASAEAFLVTTGELAQVTNADAFLFMAERSLVAPDGASRNGGETYQVHIDIEAAVLADVERGNAVTHDGQALPAETVRRITCDSSVSTHSGDQAGERTRTIKSSTRRALRRRDRGCRFPGCTNHRHLQAHHIKHWAHGGPNTITNLVLLCRHHHRMVHEGGFRVARDATTGELLFARPDGRRLAHVARPPRRPGCSSIGPEFNSQTIVPLWDGQHLHLGDAVQAILQMAPLSPAPRL